MLSTKITLGRTAASLLTACLLVPLTLSTPAVADEGQVVVQWFGQSAFKITSVTGKVIMIDPFLTKNPKTPPEHKDLAALGKIDLVLVTHAHG
ncbi:MAG: MBL fold metallo-hydrolase, partial [Chromatiaceae bacterium]